MLALSQPHNAAGKKKKKKRQIKQNAGLPFSRSQPSAGGPLHSAAAGGDHRLPGGGAGEGVPVEATGL